jgi:hypothetical protein
MRADIVPGAVFPDYELPDQIGTTQALGAPGFRSDDPGAEPRRLLTEGPPPGGGARAALSRNGGRVLTQARTYWDRSCWPTLIHTGGLCGWTPVSDPVVHHGQTVDFTTPYGSESRLPPAHNVCSMAVLPFTNMSGDPQQEDSATASQFHSWSVLESTTARNAF